MHRMKKKLAYERADSKQPNTFIAEYSNDISYQLEDRRLAGKTPVSYSIRAYLTGATPQAYAIDDDID